MADPQAPQTGAPQGVSFDFSKSQPLMPSPAQAPQAAQPQQAAQPSSPAQPPAVPQGVSFDFSKSQPLDPQNVSGEAKGDTGSTIIVPKDGESFADTVKRATDRVKQNPQQVEKEIADESTPKNLASKTAETLGGAAAIGFGGPALMATPGELAGMAKAATGELLPALTKGVKAVGEWAEAHPTMAKLVMEGIKDSALGALLYKGLKTATK